jgi:hypothetical protein
VSSLSHLNIDVTFKIITIGYVIDQSLLNFNSMVILKATSILRRLKEDMCFVLFFYRPLCCKFIIFFFNERSKYFIDQRSRP